MIKAGTRPAARPTPPALRLPPMPDAPLPSQQPRKIPRESENVLKLAEDLGLAREAWASRPTEIEFGFNNQCNLRCIMCHQADGIPPKQILLQSAIHDTQVTALATHIQARAYGATTIGPQYRSIFGIEEQ